MRSSAREAKWCDSRERPAFPNRERSFPNWEYHRERGINMKNVRRGELYTITEVQQDYPNDYDAVVGERWEDDDDGEQVIIGRDEYEWLLRVVEAAKKLDTHMMRFKEDVPLGLACLGVLLNAVLRDLNEPCKTCGGDGEEELSQDG